MTKMTYVSALDFAINALADNTEVCEKLTALKAQCEKKNAAKSGKPTAKQVANEVIKAAIVKRMDFYNLYTITQLMKVVPECAELTNQKVSALMRQLVAEHKVERVEIKGTANFRLAE